jgi:metal-responsive CopG/Arc/MetJ family transcriptional regulator|tara:strand:- start:5813 stop:6019 length:207 start_codon:yes stop_codon:yes gene_type:complete
LFVIIAYRYHLKKKEKTVKEDKKKVGVHIEKGLWDKLSDIAKKEYRSTSALVRMIISKYVEGYNNDNK